MGKSKPKQQVAEYRMSIHFGICSGPIDYISRILVGEKEAWKGRLSSLTAVRVNKPNLFGGVKKEGGVSGLVTYLPGEADQIMPAPLAAKYGKTPATMTGYRGLSSVFFTEGPTSTSAGSFFDQIHDWIAGVFSSFSGSSRKGFLWSANSPYLRGVWVEAVRAPKGLNPAYAMIARGTYPDGAQLGEAIALNIAANSFTSTNTASGGVTVSTAANDILVITKPRASASGGLLTWDAWSAWPADNSTGPGTVPVPGQTWTNGFYVYGSNGGAETLIYDGAAHLSLGLQPTANAAFDEIAALAPIVLTGYTHYRVTCVTDPNLGDDRGGLSLLVQTGSIASDANPAHMIYELLPYTDQGRSSAGTDKAAFEAAALTLFNERFGLSILWLQQSTVQDFVREVQDHIEAAIFLNPKTGLLTIKLIRDDYDPDTVPVFTPDNSTVTNFSRKLWGETINEIVVTWTNPENEEEETVTTQDLANIAVQGGQIISDSRNYYGIRRRDLAAFAAQRDLRTASAPLASCDLVCDRTAWDLLPGDVIKLVSPEDGVSAIFMRVGPIDYGKPGDSKIKVSLVEDIFSLPLADYSVPPPPVVDDTSEDPAPAAFTYVFTLPYYLVGHDVDPTVSSGIAYPEVFAGVLAAQTGNDTHSFELIGETTDAAGNPITEDLGSRSIASRATLLAPIVEEPETLVPAFAGSTVGEGPAIGGLVVIGNGTEAEVELGLVINADASGYTIRRGVLDTVPRTWEAGTPVWFVNDGLSFVDNERHSDSETVEYKVLPRTSNGLLDETDASWISTTLTGRPWLPFRPADVHVNGVAFGNVDASTLTTFPVTWVERNRLTEDSVILAWDAATVTPEAGQTTVIHLADLSGTIVHSYTGIVATNYDVVAADFGALELGQIIVKSARDGFESLQGMSRIVRILANSSWVRQWRPYDVEYPASNYATRDLVNSRPVLEFDAATQEGAIFSGIVPEIYAGGGLTVVIEWAMDTATSGNIILDAAFERIQEGVQSLDSDSFATAKATAATAVPGTAGLWKKALIAFTDGAEIDGLLAGEPFRLRIRRVAADAGDTATGDLQILGVSMREGF